MSKPRDIDDALTLSKDNRFCTCCERPLRAKFAWLELDQRDWTYHDFGGVPPEKSQGCFPFGLTCARKLIAQAEVLSSQQARASHRIRASQFLGASQMRRASRTSKSEPQSTSEPTQ
jgi:hypothetical protein